MTALDTKTTAIEAPASASYARQVTALVRRNLIHI
jgi:hypothetical protein